jgi:type IV pilus assembly protein PilM
MNNFNLKSINGKPPGVGIEINSERVNIVQLKSKGQSGYKLVNHATATLDEGIVEEGRINDPIALGEIIRGLMSDNKIKRNELPPQCPVEKQ